MINQIFSRLTVLSFSHKNTVGIKFWLCKCSCGNIKPIRQQLLVDGRAKSCGCLRKELLSKTRKQKLVGKQFGHLLVINETNKKDKKGEYFWSCQCDCGKVIEVRTSALTCKNNTSCGCKKEKQDISGQSFGRLIVSSNYNSCTGKWECSCSCGNVIQTTTGSLISGRTKSCGCIRKECINALNAAYRIAHNKNPNKPMGRRFIKERTLFRAFSLPIRSRDNFQCVLCNKTEKEINKTLHVHHIYPLARFPDLRFIKDNLVSLCEDCHFNKAHGRNYSIPPNVEIQIKLLDYIKELINNQVLK